MKKCPKCGADNRPDSSVCYNCFAPLTDVQPTATPGPLNAQPLTGPEKTQPIQPAQPQQLMGPASVSGNSDYTQRSSGPLTGPLTGPPTGQPPQEVNQQTVVGQPLGGQNPQPPSPYGPHPSPYGPQPGPYGPHPQQQYRRREESIRSEPVKSSGPGTLIAVIILALAIIVGGIFAYMKYHIPEDNTPTGVVRAFLRAADSGNKSAMRNCLTKGSQSNTAYGSFDIVGKVVDNNSHVSFGRNTEKEGVDYALKVTSSSNTRAVVSLVFLPAGYKKIEDEVYKRDNTTSPQARQFVMDFVKKFFQAGLPIVTVLEDGKWKIDEPQSEQAMQELMKKIIFETMHISPQMRQQMSPQTPLQLQR